MRIGTLNTSARAVWAILAAFAIALLLRGVWLTADPPTEEAMGIVWHDEGAWVHNARNRAMWGHWRTDNWNPVFVTPVFTGMEYAAFRLFGVGTWQARTVPLASGLLAIAALAAGLGAVGGRRASAIGAWLLATNVVFVMWNRAALMESTMTAFIVVSWAAYALAQRWRAWGLVAGAAATLAWFSKAAAAFFVVAIIAESAVTLALASMERVRRALGVDPPPASATAAARATLMGLAASVVVAGLFVVPHWPEYRFYNWQMSVTRKPSYTISALIDRASWLPMVQDFFTRMWLAVAAATIAAVGIVARWRRTTGPERLLIFWIGLGLLELIVHDAGNERRYVMFIPALVALAALVLGSPSALTAPETRSQGRWVLIPLAVFGAYLVIGSLVRLAFLPDLRAGEFRAAVRTTAVLAVAAGTLLVWRWPAFASWLSRQMITPRSAVIVVALVVAGDLAQYAQWARHRTDLNYRASVEVGRILPPATLVHGKLANGLSLENRIRPVFVGQGFGNYADRKTRDDVRYVLTYTEPYIGYEGRVIREVLAAYPRRTIVTTFPVAETAGGHDRAALFDKFGGTEANGRAHDR